MQKHLARRNQPASSRAMYAVEHLLPDLERQAKERQGTRTDRGKDSDTAEWSGDARNRAALLVGVGPSYISEAKAIAKANTDSFVLADIRSGRINLREAALLLKISQGQRTKLLRRRRNSPECDLRSEAECIRKRQQRIRDARREQRQRDEARSAKQAQPPAAELNTPVTTAPRFPERTTPPIREISPPVTLSREAREAKRRSEQIDWLLFHLRHCEYYTAELTAGTPMSKFVGDNLTDVYGFDREHDGSALIAIGQAIQERLGAVNYFEVEDEAAQAEA